MQRPKGDSIMAYRYGRREQMELFPQSIEDYVDPGDPVRAYDAFVEALDFNELGIALDEKQIGNPEYYPKAMLKLLTFGYSYGIRSSRKLERATYHNLAFIWLMGGLKPDHKTIANFRKNNKEPLKNILKQCARLCINLSLIEGNTLFTDGTKIRAAASIKNTWTKEKCERYLKDIDKHIESILSECDAIDDEEQNHGSLVKMNNLVKEKNMLKSKVQEILKDLKEHDKTSLNTIDPECTRINSLQGSHAGYNAQIVVDNKHGLIVNSDVVSKNNDLGQFAEQINQANQTLQGKCDTACADSGYANASELQKIDSKDIKVIVPSQRQASKRQSKPFDKEQFSYNAQKDEYTCPEGNNLVYKRMIKHNKAKEYNIIKASLCRECRHFNICTSSKHHGRRIFRMVDEELRQKLEAQYNDPESQAIYKLRKQKVELPFGHIKHNLKVDGFLLCGRDSAKLEMSLLSTCFNMARIITILGVRGFIQELGTVITRGSFCLYKKLPFRLLNPIFYVKEQLYKLCYDTV
jgi:transposase